MDLLLGIMRDPAMLVYLDNGQNVKDHPNENFGRELLELFTMGVGNYTENGHSRGSPRVHWLDQRCARIPFQREGPRW